MGIAGKGLLCMTIAVRCSSIYLTAIASGLGGLIVVVIGLVEVAATDESGDPSRAELPGVEAGVLDGDLLIVGVRLVGEVDAGAAGEEGDREQRKEDGAKVGVHGFFLGL